MGTTSYRPIQGILSAHQTPSVQGYLISYLSELMHASTEIGSLRLTLPSGTPSMLNGTDWNLSLLITRPYSILTHLLAAYWANSRNSVPGRSPSPHSLTRVLRWPYPHFDDHYHHQHAIMMIIINITSSPSSSSSSSVSGGPRSSRGVLHLRLKSSS